MASYRQCSMCNFEGRLHPLLGRLKLVQNDRVGVTSLGYGGTNAHTVLCAAEANGLQSQLRGARGRLLDCE